jgi:hypothetical protein
MSTVNNNDNSEDSNKKQVQIYGKYSLGSGNILSNPDCLFSDIDNPEVIESYKNSINKDMNKAGIPLSRLKDFTVLDAGTGRQAIAFYKLGAKKIKHYDLSPENVKRMNRYIESNSLQNKITTECVDLVKYAPPKNHFDLVFLHGIAPCFSNVETGLINCMDAVKEGGYISLYFYRSGVFSRFVVHLIRDLINEAADYKEYFVNSILLYSDYCQPDHFTSDVMDAFFTPGLHLYTAKNYVSFVEACGFEIVSSSMLDPYGKDVDHRYAQAAVVITCKRIKLENLRESNFNILTPERKINQLDPKNYSPEDKEILQTIKDYTSLKKVISFKKAPESVKMSIAFRVYRFLRTVPDIDEKLDNHKSLQSILKNSKSLIEKEF